MTFADLFFHPLYGTPRGVDPKAQPKPRGHRYTVSIVVRADELPPVQTPEPLTPPFTLTMFTHRSRRNG